MDAKIKELLYRVKNSAVDAGKAAGKAAGNVVEQAKLNIRIFDLNTEIDLGYKEIGKLVYAVHKGEEICSEAIQSTIESIDDKNSQIKALREKLDGMKSSALTCPACGKAVNAKDSFCAACGYKFVCDETCQETEAEECCCADTECSCEDAPVEETDAE